MMIFMLTLAAFAIAMGIMAVGVIFSNKCLHGSCGGPEKTGPDGEKLSCDNCPRRNERSRTPFQPG